MPEKLEDQAEPTRLSPEETDRLGDEIATIFAHLSAATHRLLACVRRFDAAGGWARQGALSCAHWLSWRLGLAPGAAREKVRVARALGGLREMDAALGRGEISYSQARILTRVAMPGNEGALLGLARHATAAQLERLCRRYRRVLDLEQANAGLLDELRWVRHWETEAGMVRISAQLRPEEAAVVLKALEVAGALRAQPASEAETPADVPEEQGDVPAETRDVPAETRDVPAETRDVPAETPLEVPLDPGPGDADRRRADAIVAVAEGFLAGGTAGRAGGPPFEVAVHVDRALLEGESPGLCELEDGTPIAAETARRMACDGALVYVVDAPDGTPLDVGRRTRAIPPGLRRALRRRDRGQCRFPGCENRLGLDGHHVRPWAQGGETKLSNLLCLCRRHHVLVHEGGFAVRRGEDGTPAFFDPRGRRIEAVPRPPPVAADVLGALATWGREAGRKLDERANAPQRDGDDMDYDAALEVLLEAGRSSGVA